MSFDLTGNQDQLRVLLQETQSIAIVGCSPREERDSHQIAKYMMDQGYKVIPINPAHEEILGVRAYPDLKSLPGPVDMVNVFRKPEALPEVVEHTIGIGAKSLWTQEGVVHPGATQRALSAGVSIVVDQ